MTVEERLLPASVYRPKLASLNMNFGLFPLIAKYDGRWLHDWEPQMLERSRVSVFKNTYADIETILEIGAAPMARASSLSATTRPISTTCTSFYSVASCSRRSSCRRSFASSAVLEAIPTIWHT